MNTHPLQALDPVFDYPDRVIREQADFMFIWIAHVVVTDVVWFLCSVLRMRTKT